jgi:hypothetical protein
MVDIMDFPAMCAMSVPMAKAMGNPKMLSPGVTIQAPPIPKNPPMVPTENPINTKPGQNIFSPAIGMYKYNHSMKALLSP